MQRLRRCEVLGTGWDEIIISCKLQQLPAPYIDIYEENTKVTLFSKVNFFDLSVQEKLWACYIHSCVQYIQGGFLTNNSLRIRFGSEEKSSVSISKLIKEACENCLIKKLEDTASRHTKHIPIWYNLTCR